MTKKSIAMYSDFVIRIKDNILCVCVCVSDPKPSPSQDSEIWYIGNPIYSRGYAPAYKDV